MAAKTAGTLRGTAAAIVTASTRHAVAHRAHPTGTQIAIMGGTTAPPLITVAHPMLLLRAGDPPIRDVLVSRIAVEPPVQILLQSDPLVPYITTVVPTSNNSSNTDKYVRYLVAANNVLAQGGH